MERLTRKTNGKDYCSYCHQVEFDNEVLERKDDIIEPQDFYDKYPYQPIGNEEEILNKLGAIEDLEEELGIDLITLFKALKKGIWYKHNEMKVNPKYYDNNDRWDWCDLPYYIETKKIVIEYIKKFGLRKSNDKLLFFSVRAYDDWYELYFEDYGKTWALTKEELENE